MGHLHPIILPSPETEDRINKILGLPEGTTVSGGGINVEFGLERAASVLVQIMITSEQLAAFVALATEQAAGNGADDGPQAIQPS